MKTKTQHRKKENNLPLGNSLDTQSITGEEKLQRKMPVNVDNHCAGIKMFNRKVYK